jgi:NMD protein affecting ribosome stability and mRNA decay
MYNRHKNNAHARRPRRDKMYEERVADTYLERGKRAGPVACPECGAVFEGGRWQWKAAPSQVTDRMCPACQRIHDHVPAGVLVLGGDYFRNHREEIMRLVRHVEEKEKSEHPLERIIDIEQSSNGLDTVITFTGIHLAKGTGESLQHAHHGHLDITFAERDDRILVSWHRQ